MRLSSPIDLPTGPMLWAAAGGLLTEFISLGLLWREGKSDLNTRGAIWHIIQTFVGSLLIIITALVIRFTGFLLIDPLLGMAFGFVLVWASWGILKEAIHMLMEGTPADIDLREVSDALENIEGVQDVHHIHAWALTSGENVFSAHLQVGSASNGSEVLSSAHDLLREKFGFLLITLQVEDNCLDETGAEDIDITRDHSKTPPAKSKASQPHGNHAP